MDYRIKTARFPNRSKLVQGLLMLVISASLSAQDSSLIPKSPFLPPGHGAKTAPQTRTAPVVNGALSREVEFRGLVKIGDVYKFSLFNKSEQKGHWIPENHTVEGLSVEGYDPDSMTVTVSKNGRSERLTLISATDNPLPIVITQPQATSKPQIPTPQANRTNANNNNNNNQGAAPDRRQVIPRRRVILPKN